MPIVAPILIGMGAGAIAERYGIPLIGAQMIKGQFLPQNSTQIEMQALARAQNLMRQEEGYNLTVYRDSLGFPTVGIGHKVLPEDRLKVGDTITPARADQLFKDDIGKAFSAAKNQARELNKYNPEMIARLTSVNFQMGTGWRLNFPNTWSYLKNGNWQAAIKNLRASLWAKQTPQRVIAFENTIRSQYS